MVTDTATHIVDEFTALTPEARQNAKEYIGEIPANDPLLGTHTDYARSHTMELRRTESIRFVNWIFAQNLQYHNAFGAFVLDVVKALSRAAANKLIRQRRVPDQFASIAYRYFSDAITSNALAVLYGVEYKRIVPVESAVSAEFEIVRQREQKKDGRVFFYPNTEQVNGTLINGEYNVTSVNIAGMIPELIEGRDMVLTERSDCDAWSGNVLDSEDIGLPLLAVSLARSNFVGFEAGRMSQKHRSLAEEHADSKFSRSTEREFNIFAAREVFIDKLNEADEVYERTIFALEAERLELNVLTSATGGKHENNAYEFYRARTGDSPNKQKFYAVLNALDERFKTFCVEMWEDLPQPAKPVPTMEIGTPKPERLQKRWRNSRRHRAAVSHLTMWFGKTFPNGIKVTENIEVAIVKVNGFDVPFWSTDIETWAPQSNGVLTQQLVEVFFTDVVTGEGDGI